MLTPHHRTVELAKSPTTASTSVTSDSRRLSARGLPPLRTTPLVEHAVALAAACFHGHRAVTFSAALRRPLPTAVNINAPTFRLTRQHLDPTPLGVFVVLCSTHTTRTTTARPPLQPHSTVFVTRPTPVATLVALRTHRTLCVCSGVAWCRWPLPDTPAAPTRQSPRENQLNFLFWWFSARSTRFDFCGRDAVGPPLPVDVFLDR